MAWKLTLQGFFIYLAMAGYLAAVVSHGRLRRLSRVLFFFGFLAALAGWLYRWTHVSHIPMRGMFEVFLTMAVFIWPMSQICSRLLRVSGERLDMALGAVILFPAGFVFSDHTSQMPPALQSFLFGPHVAAYLIGYVVLVKAAVQAACGFTRPAPLDPNLVDYEQGTFRLVSFGFPFLSAGLLLGSWWGALAWGDFWGWDPKEMWSLATWLIYIGYFHWRYLYGRRMPRITNAIAILGLVGITLTLLAVNLARIFNSIHSYSS